MDEYDVEHDELSLVGCNGYLVGLDGPIYYLCLVATGTGGTEFHGRHM